MIVCSIQKENHLANHLELQSSFRPRSSIYVCSGPILCLVSWSFSSPGAACFVWVLCDDLGLGMASGDGQHTWSFAVYWGWKPLPSYIGIIFSTTGSMRIPMNQAVFMASQSTAPKIPPRNKALLRAYQPVVSLNKALLNHYFLRGVR